jgi:hypothetical protein
MGILQKLKMKLPTGTKKTVEHLEEAIRERNLALSLGTTKTKPYLVGVWLPEKFEHESVLAHVKEGTPLGKAVVRNYTEGLKRLEMFRKCRSK